jgi:hypothetical protein
MTHFQGPDKPLNFTQLLLMRHTAELSFLSICGHSVLSPHFFQTEVTMNLNYSSKAFSRLPHNGHSKKSAIHEAGHAVAIYLGNNFRRFFQLYI